jgi:hypothetical protein
MLFESGSTIASCSPDFIIRVFDFVSGFVNEIYSTQGHWMVQDELKEADLMYPVIPVDTRWHKERPFYTQKVAGSSPASPTVWRSGPRFANIFANELFTT